jgi:hypothetical protein
MAGEELFVTKLHENGVLSNAFDMTPRNHQVLFPADAKKAAGTGYNERSYPSAAAILFKLKIACIAKTSPVANVDDLKSAQL